jgi:CheY-like chemotaxis protein
MDLSGTVKMLGLEGVHVLIVEDEALVAAHTAELLRELGCVPAGIAPAVADALAMINGGTKIDCATLDVRLDIEISGHVAGALMSKGIPFVVCSAYPISLPDFAHIPILEKPITKDQLRGGLERALGLQAKAAGLTD